VPGTTFIYRGGGEQVTITVTDRTKVILGVRCVVVRYVVAVGGEVVEDTEDFFAQDVEGNVRRIDMRSPQKTAAMLCLLSLGPLFCARAIAQDSEKPVKMGSLPPSVQATVKEQSRGATLRGLSKEVKGGKTFYEAELKVDGHNKDVLIDSTGAVVEVEEEVPVDSLPPAVRAEMEKHAAGGRIIMVESITKDNVIVAYEAHIKIGNKSLEIKVGSDGQLIGTENDGDDDDDVKERAGGKQKAKKP